jgi:lysophospholipase L1-like esterase
MKLIAVMFLILVLSTAGYNQTKIRVACIGNSITEGASIKSGKKYPDQLQVLLGDRYEVRNYGIGGRTLLKKGDYPYWKEDKYKEVLSWNPDIVIIKLGTNDSKPQNWQYKDDFKMDYKAFIQSFKNLPGDQKIYVCTPIPVFKDVFGIRESVVKNEMIPIIKKVAKEEKVKLIDLYKPMIGNAEMVPDGVHPDANGAAVIAQKVRKAIK